MSKKTFYVLMVIFAILAIVFCLMAAYQAVMLDARLVSAANATATYGAELFHAQLTAMASGASAGQP